MGQGGGRCCLDLPVTLGLTSPFLPSVLSTQEVTWRGPPCPSRLQPGGHGVLASPAAPRPGPPHFLSCVRRGVPGVKGAGGSGGRWTGLVTAFRAGSVSAVTASQPGQAPTPLPPPPLFPQSSGSLEQEAGGLQSLTQPYCPNRRVPGRGSSGRGSPTTTTRTIIVASAY